MSHAAKAGRKAQPDAGPAIALVPDAPERVPSEQVAPFPTDGVTPPPITLEDPWRYLHPARVWPD